MRIEPFVDTCFWGLSSALFLVFCVFFWWVVPVEEPPGEDDMLLLQAPQPVVELQETEIIHLGDKGKEWSLRAKLISQKDAEVELNDIAGYFFRDEKPLYSFAASRGKVSLESGDAVFWEVNMQEADGKKFLRGELLQWIAEGKRCILKEATFRDQEVGLSGDEIIYELEVGKLHVSGDVVVNVKLAK